MLSETNHLAVLFRSFQELMQCKHGFGTLLLNSKLETFGHIVLDLTGSMNKGLYLLYKSLDMKGDRCHRTLLGRKEISWRLRFSVVNYTGWKITVNSYSSHFDVMHIFLTGILGECLNKIFLTGHHSSSVVCLFKTMFQILQHQNNKRSECITFLQWAWMLFTSTKLGQEQMGGVYCPSNANFDQEAGTQRYVNICVDPLKAFFGCAL